MYKHFLAALLQLDRN